MRPGVIQEFALDVCRLIQRSRWVAVRQSGRCHRQPRQPPVRSLMLPPAHRMPRLLASLLPRCAPNQEDLAVLPRLPIEQSALVAGLTALMQQEEWARTELELAADDRDAHGKDSAAIRRRLQRSRPVMLTAADATAGPCHKVARRPVPHPDLAEHTGTENKPGTQPAPAAPPFAIAVRRDDWAALENRL